MKEGLSILSSLRVTAPQFSMTAKILSLSPLAIWQTRYLSQYFNSYWVDIKDNVPREILAFISQIKTYRVDQACSTQGTVNTHKDSSELSSVQTMM